MSNKHVHYVPVQGPSNGFRPKDMSSTQNKKPKMRERTCQAKGERTEKSPPSIIGASTLGSGLHWKLLLRNRPLRSQDAEALRANLLLGTPPKRWFSVWFPVNSPHKNRFPKTRDRLC